MSDKNSQFDSSKSKTRAGVSVLALNKNLKWIGNFTFLFSAKTLLLSQLRKFNCTWSGPKCVEPGLQYRKVGQHLYVGE